MAKKGEDNKKLFPNLGADNPSEAKVEAADAKSADSAPLEAIDLNSIDVMGGGSEDADQGDLLFDFNSKGKEDKSEILKGFSASKDKGSILGPKPKLSPEQLKIHHAKHPLGSLVLKLSVLALIVFYAFFYTQLKPGFTLFGDNPVIELNQLDITVVEEQTELNVQNFLTIKLYFDYFNHNAENYFSNKDLISSPYTSNNLVPGLQSSASDLRGEMLIALESVQKLLDEPTHPKILEQIVPANELELEFSTAFQAQVADSKAGLMQKLGQSEQVELTRELNDLDTALNLYSNSALLNQIKSMDLQEATDEELIAIRNLYNQDAQSIIALVSSVKSNRVAWTPIITEIKKITKKVDPLFETQLGGNIHYNSYSIHSDKSEIVVAGSALTVDAKNFTMIANLVDMFELSNIFANVQTSTFSKSSTNSEEEDSFRSNFQISMELEKAN